MSEWGLTLKIDRDMQVTWPVAICVLSAAVVMIAGVLFIATFTPDFGKEAVTARIISGGITAVCLIAFAQTIRKFKAEANAAVAKVEVDPVRRAASDQRRANLALMAGPVVLAMAIFITYDNYSRAVAGGTYVIPVKTLAIGVLATV